MFVEIENSKGVKNFIEEQINKLNWDEKEKKDFYNEVIEKIETSTTKSKP